MQEKIKLIIFDLDGVLMDTKDLHYHALNNAIQTVVGSQYVITLDEHLAVYDGLNTSKKLEMLTATKGLPKAAQKAIFDLKQQETQKLVKQLPVNEKLYADLEQLSTKYILNVASNSIRQTVKNALVKTQLIDHVEHFYSNEDVTKPKPHPEMYMLAMLKAKVSPEETLIIEDSYTGRLGASQTGAHVMGVNSMEDVTLENISSFIEQINNQPATKKWYDSKLNVLIPMAGRGSRFEVAGYTLPKPLIDVDGIPMIQKVVQNLNVEATFIYLVQKEHYEKYNLGTMLNLITPGCKIVQVDGITEGAACTTLLAKEHIDNNDGLLMANSDQFIEWNSGEFMYSMVGGQVDGGIVTFTATDAKWSFAKVDEHGWVTEVAEKKPISNIATVGVYYWKRGSDYVKYAEQMISKNIRVNNEFYVCPVFNEAIQDGKKIKIHNINKMWGLGTPEDLNHYLNNYRK